ncbi:MAG: hypothetical protein R6X19_11605, partial [Kiritimatiellia bacterium]
LVREILLAPADEITQNDKIQMRLIIVKGEGSAITRSGIENRSDEIKMKSTEYWGGRGATRAKMLCGRGGTPSAGSGRAVPPKRNSATSALKSSSEIPRLRSG